MNPVLVQLITAFFGSLGFALLFGLRRRYLFTASLGGVLAWGIYLAAEGWLHTVFLPCLLAAAFTVLYAELLARAFKSPATLFLIPAIIPLVPGSSLYYAMSCAVRGELEAARGYGMLTLKYTLAIAAGISIVMAFRELRTRQR